jgi:drug/metabolite transporter (DMT)-like permease
MMTWQLYILFASVVYTTQNILRKKLFNESNITSEKAWTFILLGILVGVIISLTYVCFFGNIGEKNTKPLNIISECLKSKNKNIHLGFSAAGITILIGMTLLHSAFKLVPNVAYLPLLLGGLTVIFTYVASTVFLDTPIKMMKVLGIIITLIGCYMVSF